MYYTHIYPVSVNCSSGSIYQHKLTTEAELVRSLLVGSGHRFKIENEFKDTAMSEERGTLDGRRKYDRRSTTSKAEQWVGTERRIKERRKGERREFLRI